MKSSVFRLCSYFDSATSYFIGPYGLNDKVRATFKYDAMHLMALAVEKAGSTEGEKIRQGLYAIDTHQGLIKTY